MRVSWRERERLSSGSMTCGLDGILVGDSVLAKDEEACKIRKNLFVALKGAKRTVASTCRLYLSFDSHNRTVKKFSNFYVVE